MSASLAHIEAFLQESLEHLLPCEHQAPHAGAPRILPSLCLWAGLLVCIARGCTSQLALWRLLSLKGLWDYPRFPVSDQAIYNRLAREGTAPLEQLMKQISALLADRLAPLDPGASLAAFAQEVYALDETTLDPVARMLPSLQHVPVGSPALLPGKLSSLFNIRTQQWHTLAYQENPEQNEKVAARDMVTGLPKGSLLLADLGYFGFAWFDWLTEQGYWWLSRLREKTSYQVLQIRYQEGETLDALVFLGAYRADRAAHAVRLIQYEVQGVIYRYLTNVLDPALLSLPAIAHLYARRWDIELAFKLVKQQLKLACLWSAKREVIVQQVWATLIIAQIVHCLQLEVAARAGVDPFDVSLPLLVQYLPDYAREGKGDPLDWFVKVGRQARFIRPSRRIQVQAPDPPLAAYTPWNPELVLIRTARHSPPNRSSGGRRRGN